jgi:hypothetical protein
MAEIQWIAMCEGFRFIPKFVIKELSLMCIQTKQCHTFHIEPTISDYFNTNLSYDKNRQILELGLKRHGMSWSAGTHQYWDVKDILDLMIAKHVDIFVIDKDLCALLKNWGFESVEMITIAPMKNLNNCPGFTCKSYGHDAGFKHCARRKCFEAMFYLDKVLVQYLDPNILIHPTKKLSHPDFEVKYGEMKVDPTINYKLAAVRLPLYFNGITNCKLCVAGSDGCACSVKKTEKQGGADSKCSGGEASDGSAGATDCKV